MSTLSTLVYCDLRCALIHMSGNSLAIGFRGLDQEGRDACQYQEVLVPASQEFGLAALHQVKE